MYRAFSCLAVAVAVAFAVAFVFVIVLSYLVFFLGVLHLHAIEAVDLLCSGTNFELGSRVRVRKIRQDNRSYKTTTDKAPVESQM